MDNNNMDGHEDNRPALDLTPFERAMLHAQGSALALIAVYLRRAGIVEAHEFGRTLGILAVTAKDGKADEPDTVHEADILGVWAGIVIDTAKVIATH